MKKMNKKLLLFAVVPLCVGLVVAIGYYAMFSTTFNVLPSIVTDGVLEQTLGDVYDGEIVEGDSIVLTNNAPSSRVVNFEEETECNIETSYATTLELNQKVPSGDWEIIADTTKVLSYVVVGDEFKYKVDTELVNYVVVYYPDLDGNPGSWNIDNAQLVGDANTVWTSSAIDVLPSETDWNDKAKLWIIPKADWETKSWNPTEWYFENNLITYGNEVSIDAESSLTIIPLYDIAVGESGDCTITTTVN